MSGLEEALAGRRPGDAEGHGFTIGSSDPAAGTEDGNPGYHGSKGDGASLEEEEPQLLRSLQVAPEDREVHAIATYQPSAAVSPHHRVVVVVEASSTPAVFCTGTGERIAELVGHAAAVWCVAVFDAEDGRPCIATGGEDGSVMLWNGDVRDPNGQGCGEALHVLRAHASVRTLYTYPSPANGRPRVVALSRDPGAALRVWDAESGEHLRDCHMGVGGDEGYEGLMIPVLVGYEHAEGARHCLLITDSRGRLWAFDAESGEARFGPLDPDPTGDRVTALVCFHAPRPDADDADADEPRALFLCLYEGGAGVEVREAETGALAWRLPVPVEEYGRASCIAVFHEETQQGALPRLVAGTDFGGILVFDGRGEGLQGGSEPIHVLDGHYGEVVHLALLGLEDGGWRLVSEVSFTDGLLGATHSPSASAVTENGHRPHFPQPTGEGRVREGVGSSGGQAALLDGRARVHGSPPRALRARGRGLRPRAFALQCGGGRQGGSVGLAGARPLGPGPRSQKCGQARVG
jgi:hypothetical protein